MSSGGVNVEATGGASQRVVRQQEEEEFEDPMLLQRRAGGEASILFYLSAGPTMLLRQAGSLNLVSLAAKAPFPAL